MCSCFFRKPPEHRHPCRNQRHPRHRRELVCNCVLFAIVYTYVYTNPCQPVARGDRRMEFEWDEEKNEANIRKHGFDFADGEELFDEECTFLVAPDEQEDYGEEGGRGIGTIRGRVVTVTFTDRRPNLTRFFSLT